MNEEVLKTMSTKDLGQMLIAMQMAGDKKETMQPVIDEIKRRKDALG